MQIRINRVEVSKTIKGADKSKIQGSDNATYMVMGNLSNLQGRVIEINPKPFGKNNDLWAMEFTVIQGEEPATQQPQTSSQPTPTVTGHYAPPAKIGFWLAVDTVKTLHNQFSDKESDPIARAAMINTMMIAITSGKVEMPPEGPVEQDNVPEFDPPSLNPLPPDGKPPF